MEFGIRELTQIVAEGMEKDPHVAGVEENLMAVFTDGEEMTKGMAHDNNSVNVVPISAWKRTSK